MCMWEVGQGCFLKIIVYGHRLDNKDVCIPSGTSWSQGLGVWMGYQWQEMLSLSLTMLGFPFTRQKVGRVQKKEVRPEGRMFQLIFEAKETRRSLGLYQTALTCWLVLFFSFFWFPPEPQQWQHPILNLLRHKRTLLVLDSNTLQSSSSLETSLSSQTSPFQFPA